MRIVQGSVSIEVREYLPQSGSTPRCLIVSYIIPYLYYIRVPIYVYVISFTCLALSVALCIFSGEFKEDGYGIAIGSVERCAF